MDAEKRTVEIAFSSEYPVDRGEYDEVLDHNPDSCDMTRISDGAPLLLCHDAWDGMQQIGVVESARIDADKVGRANVRFGKSDLSNQIWQDVQDGIRRHVSVGYARTGIVSSEKTNNREVVRYRWMPFELSIVPVPADPTVGVGRIESIAREFSTPETKMRILLDKTTDGGGGTATLDAAKITEIETRVRNESFATEQKRCLDINDTADRLCELHPHGTAKFREIARAGIKDKKTSQDVSTEMLTAIPGLKKVEGTDARIGMTDKEIKRFSLMRGIQQIVARGRLEGLEKEVSDAAAGQYRVKDLKDGSIILPEEIIQRNLTGNEGFSRAEFFAYAHTFRAQNVTTQSAGGFTVATILGPLIEFLRNETVLGRLGITELSGLMGDIALPVQTGGTTAYWVSETGTLTDSQATFGQKAMTPHRLGATLPYTTQFLAQSSLSAEAFLNAELMTVIGIELDRAGLLGSGVDGEPLGVANTTGINATVTYSGAAAWADVVEHETGITVDNAAIGDMAFALSSAAVGKWKTILRDSVAGATYLINPDTNTANGYRYERTNQISAANQSFFGVWRQLLRGTWAGREVIVDPYTLKKSGQVEITMNQFHDYLARQPLAFNISTDSAAQ